jgi:hypothetical protein
MELLSNTSIPDGLLASMTLLSEKPRLGVPSRKSALHQRIDQRNCTAVLGLRFPCSEIVSGTVVAPNNGFTKYHCDLTGNCYKGPAINAKQIQCAQQALAKNGVALALDVAGVGAGFLPGGDLVVEGAQIGVGAASTVNSAIGGDLGGSLTSIFGIQLSALAPAAKWAGVGARAVPVLGSVVSAFGAANDAWQTYQSYQSCLAGHS